jgi:hypothetical protein
MDTLQKAVLVVIVIVVIAAIGINAQSADITELQRTISGYWVGKDDFLKKKNYSDFQLFISPKTDGIHHGYAIIARDDHILYNSPVTIRLYNLSKKSSLHVRGKIHFENHGDFEIQLPETADVVWSAAGDDFMITDLSGKVVFDGYKDVYTSMVSREEWYDFNFQENFTS